MSLAGRLSGAVVAGSLLAGGAAQATVYEVSFKDQYEGGTPFLSGSFTFDTTQGLNAAVDTTVGSELLVFPLLATTGAATGADDVYFGDTDTSLYESTDGVVGLAIDNEGYYDGVYDDFVNPAIYSGSGLNLTSGTYQGESLPNTMGLGYTTTYTVSALPEPGSWVSMVLGAGLAGAAARRRRCAAA